MFTWPRHGEQEYEISVVPDGEGFTGIISRVRREDGHVVWREEWRRLALPRPTKRLAEADAQALAAALLDQADAEAARASGAAIEPPHVTAGEVIARARSVASGVIGDGLYDDLGRPVRAYYYGFERALQQLRPPKEIPASATIYWAGHRDGQAAHPKLLDAGVLTGDWGSIEHWRDIPNMPAFERTVLTGGDLFADYSVDLMRIKLQPVYEPGYPPAEGEIRETQFEFLYLVTALLYERPLPRKWLDVGDVTPRLLSDDFGRRFRRLLGSHSRPRREYNFLPRTVDRDVPGRLNLVEAFDEPEYDAASSMAEMQRIVGSAVALLEEFRREAPDEFIRDPVTVSLQRRAAELRHIAARGPTQIAEITDERAAARGEEGWAAQRQVRGWNENARRNYQERISELPLLEEQIRARFADPDDPGGWAPRDPWSDGSPHYPHQGAAFLGGQPSASPGITDEQLIYEITSIVEREAPGEFRIEGSQAGLVELHPIHPQPIVQRSATASPLPPRTPDAYPQLMTALFSAACRWRTRPWDILELPRPGQERHQSQPRWMGNASGRWHASLRRNPTVRHDAPSDPSDGIRREYVYIAIQLAPPDCRVPAEWEC